MKPVELAIVGGGAAGMFAAAVAAERGVRCVLIERKARLGSKVLMTANGRCNFTKDISSDQFLKDVGGCAPFVRRAVEECPPRKIIAGFKSLNVPLRRMADGRMFPADGKAATIVHAFGDLLRDSEVPILTNCAVREIIVLSNNRIIESMNQRVDECEKARFLVRTGNFDIAAENVLLATGGVSYPKTGSVGDGQNFAKSLGHTVVPYRPGLIGLETSDPKITRLAGRRFEDGRVKVFASSLVPHSLTRSEAQLHSLAGSEAQLHSLVGSEAQLHSLTRSEAQLHSLAGSEAQLHSLAGSEAHLHSLVGSEAPGKLLFDYRGEVDCESFGLSGAAIYNAQRFIEHYARQNSTSASSLHLTLEVWFERNRLQYKNLKPRPVKEAIVTIGGVDTREIDPATMESKIVPGLYFAGEVMDIDGPTGGYNLTLAFATARKAVLAVSC